MKLWPLPRKERPTDLFWKVTDCNYIVNVYTNYMQRRNKNPRKYKIYSQEAYVERSY